MKAKNQLFLLIGLIAYSAFANATIIKSYTNHPTASTQTISDTSIKVSYLNNAQNNKAKMAYFLNGQMIDETVLKTLDPTIIADVNVISGNYEIDNITYPGKIQIFTKDDYTPKISSLNQIKNKYTNLSNAPTVFLLDNEIVNIDYDRFWVDENYLLEIVVEKIENPKENILLNVVKLFTKSMENLKKLKEGKTNEINDIGMNN